MKFVCPRCDHEERPIRLQFRVGKRKVRCCRACFGVVG